MGAVQLNERRHLLLGFALSALLFALYLGSKGAFAGAFISLLTCTSNLVQAYLPCNEGQRCLKGRMIVSLGVAFVGTLLLFQNGSDMFPILAFIAGRFCEAQSTSQRIRLWIMPQHIAWMAYGISYHMPIIVLGELLWGMATTKAIVVEHNRTKKAYAVVKR